MQSIKKSKNLKYQLFLGIIIVFLPLMLQAQQWGITITGNTKVVLENAKIRATYSKSSSTNDIQINPLFNKTTGENLGLFAGGIGRKVSTLNAQIIFNDVEKQTVRITWGDVIEEITIRKDGAYVAVTRIKMLHTWDKGPSEGSLIAYGAQGWLNVRKASPPLGDPCSSSSEPFKLGGMDQKTLYPLYHKSFYCKTCGLDTAVLDYKGYMIIGYYRNSGTGYGMAMEINKTSWMKLLVFGKGFEHFNSGLPVRIIYFVSSTGGAQGVIATAKQIVDAQDDIIPPKLVSASVTGANTFEVLFNEAVDKTSAEATFHYIVGSKVKVTNVVLGSNPKMVTITTDKVLALGQSYLFQVNGVEDVAGNAMSSAKATLIGLGGSLNIDMLRTPSHIITSSPNPMNKTISFTMESGFQNVELVVYDGAGNVVNNITAGNQLILSAKQNTEGGNSLQKVLKWDGTDSYGNPVQPGIYLYSLSIDGVERGGKIVKLQ